MSVRCSSILHAVDGFSSCIHISFKQSLPVYKVTQNIKASHFTSEIFRKICVQNMLNFVCAYKETPISSDNELRKKIIFR